MSKETSLMLPFREHDNIVCVGNYLSSTAVLTPKLKSSASRIYLGEQLWTGLFVCLF